ncbi:MAG: LamG domain-containing protein [Moorea sp. SIO4G2]|uniref:LamG domain-containing protein n=1 Tax=Moorena bouillonii PNG TaxID=568701 RepID=A0A1U7MZI6_9CYAN|nr:LamG-like jellyroll fold domain-containing protein [Moorena bouillonii]NEO61730.1 LamG domain-containing protein [Moorena sp. SIO4G2]OLT59099.1 hypothetical protein BJP37_08670 [Moorena bouillonii PNG]
MFTPDPTDLVAEYLFETPTDTGVIRNTANPGTFDGMIQHDPDAHPLAPSADVPPGFVGSASLNYNVLRRLSDSGESPQMSFAQYVEVPNFPDLANLTVETWVKVDYIKANPAFTDPPQGTYPDGEVGFGACPQPICKAFSWYLFLSTLQTDRNLILTIIPNNVTQGLPKEADETSGSGGVVSEDIVHGGQWTHMAATFGEVAPGRFIMQTYINGIQSHIEEVRDFNGNIRRIPNQTDNPIAPSPGRPLRLGQFRDIQGNLDYQYSGLLAGVRIYSRALTQEQIQADYRHDICSGTGPLGKEIFRLGLLSLWLLKST